MSEQELVPVWSRRVWSDVRVTDWKFFGWFRSLQELSEWIGDQLHEDGFHREKRLLVSGTSKHRDFQFLFVYDWKGWQIGKTYAPYCI